MTDVIGHDCDGRPLRVGDRVVFLRADDHFAKQFVGRVATLLEEPDDDGDIWTDLTAEGGTLVVDGTDVRKLPDDKPANQSFEELMNQLKKEGATT